MGVFLNSKISYSGPYTIDSTGYTYSKTVSSTNAISFTRIIDDCILEKAPLLSLSTETEDNNCNKKKTDKRKKNK